MGFFSELGDIFRDTAVSVCTKIGGAVMNGVSKFVARYPELEIGIMVVLKIVDIICKVADLLIGKPKDETPEELGLKAERCKEEEGLTPEDFASTEAYIDHLRNDIKVDHEKMAELSKEQLQAYAAIGTGLYVRAMEDRYGMKMEPEFWRAIYRTNIAPEQVPALVQSMRAAGVESGKLLDAYLAGTIPAMSADDRIIHTALTDYAHQLGAEAPPTIMNMRQNYHTTGGTQ